MRRRQCSTSPTAATSLPSVTTAVARVTTPAAREGEAHTRSLLDELDAARFALRVQEELHSAEWPRGLSDIGDAATEPNKAAAKGQRVKGVK